MSENYDMLREIAANDVKVLEVKGATYGTSWRKRGGVGAFMMLARKWDRIENQCEEGFYDIFKRVEAELAAGITKDGLLDDIQDLRRYLLLVEGHLQNQRSVPVLHKPHLVSVHLGGGLYGPACSECGKTPDNCKCGEPGPGYVDQD